MSSGVRRRATAWSRWAESRWVRLQHLTWFRFVTTAATLFGQRRIFGLSAEGAFWATFTLPWLVLGAAAATSGVAAWFGVDITDQLLTSVTEGASQVLTQQAIDTTLVPLLRSVSEGSAGLSILGFLVALWSGSRVFATFVAGSEILHGQRPRGFWVTRGIALGVYVLGLVTLGALVFTAFRFPDFWTGLVGLAPGPNQLWAAVLGTVLLVVSLTSVLFLVDPTGTSWWRQLPGGVLALAVWVVASWGLSIYFQRVVEAESVYGAIAAPIAIMLWLFVSVLALFVGMTVNAAAALVDRDRYLDPWDPYDGPKPISDLPALPSQASSGSPPPRPAVAPPAGPTAGPGDDSAA